MGQWQDFSGDAWRVESRAYVRRRLSAEHTARRPGRWHSAGQTALYLNANVLAVVANAHRTLGTIGDLGTPRNLYTDGTLDGGRAGLLSVREVRVRRLPVADIRRGGGAESWSLPESYPLVDGAEPGDPWLDDRTVAHADCRVVADRVRSRRPSGIWSTSAALNGHAAAVGAEEVTELDPKGTGQCTAHGTLELADWVERYDGDGALAAALLRRLGAA